MPNSLWILGVCLTGALHFVTLTAVCLTPIPPDWDRNLANIPPIHHRFALAQNFSIGATIGALTAFFWAGRAVILPWLGGCIILSSPALSLGFTLLIAECVIYASYCGSRYAPALVTEKA